jgi:hypothetical protein
MTPMNDWPHGLNSWANPATAASASTHVVVGNAERSGTGQYQMEQLKGPSKQFVLVSQAHSPQTHDAPFSSMQVQ